MNLRQSKILTAVIEEFINTNNLISSDFLFSEKGFNNVSPATIRNDLMFLEKQGYLKKQHISSGRIPTIKGYKFFVDNILKNINELNNNFEINFNDIEEKFFGIVNKIHLPSICNLIDGKIYYKFGLKFTSEYPEFKNSDYMFNFLNIFENFENHFKRIIDYFDKYNKNFSVFIGEEKISKKFKPFSIISRIVKTKKGKVLFSTIGPYRINYKSAIKNLLNF